MANYIFQGILDEQINFFVKSFSDTSPKIFINEETGKLLHPGEFGMYREEVLKNFLRILVPYRLDINQGFIIGENNYVSNQCDVIIYERNTSPLIISAEKQRFYPIEVVASVGEVKSDLSKKELMESLIKLSKIKQARLSNKNHLPSFRVKIKDSNILKYTEFDPEVWHNDQIFTFIVCNKLKFKLNNFFKKIDDFYDKENIPYSCRHNIIVSMQDGTFEYYKSEGKPMPYPVMYGQKLPNVALTPNSPLVHLNRFANCLYMSTSISTLLFPDISNYMNPVDVTFKEY